MYLPRLMKAGVDQQSASPESLSPGGKLKRYIGVRWDALWRAFSCENAFMSFAVIRSRILHGAVFAAALLLSTGLLLQKAAAATTLTLTWQASPSSPNIDGYRVYYGTSSGKYSQHVDVLGTVIMATVAGSTLLYRNSLQRKLGE